MSWAEGFHPSAADRRRDHRHRAIAVPDLSRPHVRQRGVGDLLRAINTAQQNYSQRNGYSPNLKTMGAPNGFLSPDMSANDPTAKSGFSISDAGVGVIVPNPPAACGAPQVDFFAEGHPLNIGTTGTRSFSTDSQGTIWQDSAGVTFLVIPVKAAGTVSLTSKLIRRERRHGLATRPCRLLGTQLFVAAVRTPLRHFYSREWWESGGRVHA